MQGLVWIRLYDTAMRKTSFGKSSKISELFDGICGDQPRKVLYREIITEINNVLAAVAHNARPNALGRNVYYAAHKVSRKQVVNVLTRDHRRSHSGKKIKKAGVYDALIVYEILVIAPKKGIAISQEADDELPSISGLMEEIPQIVNRMLEIDNLHIKRNFRWNIKDFYRYFVDSFGYFDTKFDRLIEAYKEGNVLVKQTAPIRVDDIQTLPVAIDTRPAPLI